MRLQLQTTKYIYELQNLATGYKDDTTKISIFTEATTTSYKISAGDAATKFCGCSCSRVVGSLPSYNYMPATATITPIL